MNIFTTMQFSVLAFEIFLFVNLLKYQVVQILDCRQYIFYTVINSATFIFNKIFTGPLRFQLREYRIHILMKERQSHIIEDHMGWEMSFK